MKNYLLIVMMLICTYAYSQNRIDPVSVIDSLTPQSIFNFNADSAHFVKGWNWSSPGKNLDNALHINTYHDYPTYSTNTADSMKMIKPLGNWQNWIIGGRNGNFIFNAHCIHLEPTITVDSTDSFVPKGRVRI